MVQNGTNFWANNSGLKVHFKKTRPLIYLKQMVTCFFTIWTGKDVVRFEDNHLLARFDVSIRAKTFVLMTLCENCLKCIRITFGMYFFTRTCSESSIQT